MLKLEGADLQPTTDSVHTRHTLVQICLSVAIIARRAAGLTNEVCRQSQLQQAQVSLKCSKDYSCCTQQLLFEYTALDVS